MPLKIMTYNVDLRSAEDPHIALRIGALIKLIKSVEPDIICFQEFGKPALPLAPVLAFIGDYQFHKGDRDVCTLFKEHISIHAHRDVKFMYNTSSMPIFSKAGMIGKGCSLFRLSSPKFKSGSVFGLANTHLEPHGKNETIRGKQFRTMVTSLDALCPGVGIIVGDLNDPYAPALAATYGFMFDKEKMITHHHEDNVRRKNKREAARKDFVFIRGGSILPGSVETQRIKYTFDSRMYDISDHSPILTTVQ